MTSIKVKLRPSTVEGREGTIFYQITHQRKTRQLATDFHVSPRLWDKRRDCPVADSRGIHGSIPADIREKVRHDVERLKRIINKMEQEGAGFTVDEIVLEFKRHLSEYSLFNFMRRIILNFRSMGRVRCAETYTSTLNDFRKFRGGEDIMLDCLTGEIMESYEAWLRRREIVPNTVSFYIRILRATYNRAVEQEITENNYPFRHVYTGVDRTVKRAIPLEMVSRIKSLNLSDDFKLDYARDMFMMSFYLRGMSFIDMAFLKKTDLCDGCVTYRRRKTGQRLSIGWTGEMQQIMEKYPTNDSMYLLPIIRRAGLNERRAYRNMSYNINRSLKIIAGMAGIRIPLTLYVARHSWASAAKTKGVPLSVISQGMGHDCESTTRIYLASLDSSVVDRANSMILKSL